jgi:hypothetical protein
MPPSVVLLDLLERSLTNHSSLGFFQELSLIGCVHRANTYQEFL